MDSHRKLLSILHLVYGAGTIILFLFLNTLFSTIFPFIASEINDTEGPQGAAVFEMVTGMVQTVILVILIFIPIPSIIGGIAYLNQKNWGLTLMMVSGCLSLLSFPIGTALGVYTIWTFLNAQKQEKAHDISSQ